MEASLHVNQPPKGAKVKKVHPHRIVNKNFMKVPKSQPSAEETLMSRKRMMCQQEIEQSTAGLLKSTLGHFAKNENHAKKFKIEMDNSPSVNALLADHLGWVSKLPSTAQLLTLIGEKWLRTRL